MDYETLIENLVYWSKAYHVNPRSRYALGNAANAITDLLARAEAAEKRAEKAERERDAAVRDIESIMAYGGKLNTCHFCKNAQCHERGGTKPCLPKWYQKEE